MARPPKDPADVKSVDVRIPMTKEQKEAVLSAAAVADADVAAWARPILLREAQAQLSKKSGVKGIRGRH
jgi:hypothetical protein